MPFNSFGLNQRLVDAVRAAGYTTPTAIQQAAIPVVIAGEDIVGCAQTGTGKTAAFVLPMLERLMAEAPNDRKRRVRALVLTPTRELALQVEATVKTCGKFTKLKSFPIFGGVGIEPQTRALRAGMADIIIATPGRLIDHINRRNIDLSTVEIFVLDEADRMFDMGFINDVRKVVSLMPKNRQTLLFSATMSSSIRSLAEGIQRNPKLIEVGERRNPAATVEQHIYPVHQEQKMDLLLHIFENEAMESVLVFSRTKHGADRIADRLERNGIPAVALHSDRTQNQRLRALDNFKRGRVKVMVATDIAARGIDVNGISHVINFDTPTCGEDYIHRIGRTGRAETTGDAMTFVSRSEEQHLRKMEHHIGKRFTRKDYPGFTHARPAAADRSYSDGPRRERRFASPVTNETRDPRFDRDARSGMRGRSGNSNSSSSTGSRRRTW